MQSHCGFQKFILPGAVYRSQHLGVLGVQKSYILKTSSAVLRTMKDRGSDWRKRKQRLKDHFHCGLTVLYTLCPNPERTFSRFLTASINAGTFSGLDDIEQRFTKNRLKTYFPMDISIRMTASFAPPSHIK